MKVFVWSHQHPAKTSWCVFSFLSKTDEIMMKVLNCIILDDFLPLDPPDLLNITLWTTANQLLLDWKSAEFEVEQT